MLHLLSRFVKSARERSEPVSYRHINKITKAIGYFNENISKPIEIKELSDMSYCSNDYFSKIFVKIMGTTPVDYINLKKVESAQLQLITSDDPIEKISLQVGIDNFPYFIRMFKKYTHNTPGEYRKLHKVI